MGAIATPSPVTVSHSILCDYWDFKATLPDQDQVIGKLQIQVLILRAHAIILAVDVEEDFTRQGIATQLYTAARLALQARGYLTVSGCLEGSGIVPIREAVFGAGATSYFQGQAELTVEEAIHHMDVDYGRLIATSRLT
jgi:GNAT superfamily N-acetyltransferase